MGERLTDIEDNDSDVCVGWGEFNICIRVMHTGTDDS